MAEVMVDFIPDDCFKYEYSFKIKSIKKNEAFSKLSGEMLGRELFKYVRKKASDVVEVPVRMLDVFEGRAFVNEIDQTVDCDIFIWVKQNK